MLEKIPARLKVIRHVRPRYACRACEAVLQAPASDLPPDDERLSDDAEPPQVHSAAHGATGRILTLRGLPDAIARLQRTVAAG